MADTERAEYFKAQAQQFRENAEEPHFADVREDVLMKAQWLEDAASMKADLLAAIEALERIETERYPAQVFLPMTDKQWHSLKLWCESEGFPIDRLSGNYGRELRAADRAIARSALERLAKWKE